jgi:hypothetical protein
MADQDRVCLLDVASGKTQDLIWTEPASIPWGKRGFGYGVRPSWSPDGRQIWFGLTESLKLPAPCSLGEAAQEAWRFVRPALYNLNPRRTARWVGYRRFANRHIWGVADLEAKRIVLTPGFYYGVTWLPAN